ncbi:hypothetical protein CXB51_012578 [Gossypium anomalum]|uniref:Receptor-like serine/threonine-protein kinase n=1 Tax=Gossypium anomalum TaxID=47600 RepID=A0A8J6D123_9ROSI|nr:hypothetical protein CXB51_012578 [Gossypium anomalum]
MGNKRRQLIFLISSFTCSICVSSSGVETDTLAAGQELKDAESGYLISAGGTFRLGFFSPGSSNNRYLGMWYNQPQPADRKAVWVANRDNPLFDKSGILIIDEVGSLKVSHGGGSPFVLSSPVRTAGNVSATLLDYGNFILRELSSDGSTKRILWQSFDYPTDTLLPGMKLGINLKTGHNWSLSSWISDAVPATGSFTLGVDPSGASQWIISWKGKPYWTSGLWRNRDKHFDLAPELSNESDHHFSYTENEEERYFSFSTNKNHSMSGYSITSSGEILERSKAAPFRSCGLYRSNNLPTGCIQPTAHKCSTYFVQQYKHSKASFKGKFKFGEYSNLSLYDCNANCSSDCSCVAFAYDDRTASCDVWSRGLSSKSHPIFYKETTQIYMLADNSSKLDQSIFLVVSLVLALDFLSTMFLLIVKELIRSKVDETEVEMLLNELGANGRNKEGKTNRELQFFSLETIAHATNNFAATNKLGEGGFGPVYKGKLHSGQKIAVKRLSTSSGQGLKELKNEALLIAKLQHTNLVRLEGCCLEKEEKMLIYEYMPNKSLDFFLFEYAMDGIYSTRSDMFSFGVLLLEIITGRKNNSFHSLSGPLSLVAYAWEAWNEGRALELIDPSLGESYPKDEVMRCIHVGLLCGQDNPVDRPTILDALSMMYSEGNQLPTAKPPAYYFSRSRDEPEIVECELQIFSPNNLSITEMEAR